MSEDERRRGGEGEKRRRGEEVLGVTDCVHSPVLTICYSVLPLSVITSHWALSSCHHNTPFTLSPVSYPLITTPCHLVPCSPFPPSPTQQQISHSVCVWKIIPKRNLLKIFQFFLWKGFIFPVKNKMFNVRGNLISQMALPYVQHIYMAMRMCRVVTSANMSNLLRLTFSHWAEYPLSLARLTTVTCSDTEVTNYRTWCSAAANNISHRITE